MISLQIFTIMECKVLKIFPKTYLDLKTLQKVRVYGCSIIVENFEEIRQKNTQIEVVIICIQDLQEAKSHYSSLACTKNADWYYGEFWYNELFLFMKSLRMTLIENDFLS